MWATRILLAWIITGIVDAQPGRLMSATGVLTNGLTVKFDAFAEPPLNSSLPSQTGLGGIKVDQNRIHRFLIDKSSGSYFGYDLQAEPATTGHFLVTFLPLQPTKELAGLMPALMPRIPPPQSLQEGDTIMLDLLISTDRSRKIVDYVRVFKHEALPKAQPSPVILKSYTIDDGPLNFLPQGGYQVFINEEKQFNLGGLTSKSGSTLWFYFPGKGSYILSLAPPAGFGFQPAGTIHDNEVSFQEDGNRYLIRFAGRLLLSDGAYRLYVIRSPAYRPVGPGEQMMILGGIDRFENLVAR